MINEAKDYLKTKKGCDVCGKHERAKEVRRGWLCKECLKGYINWLEEKERKAQASNRRRI